ncbi:MAG: DUF2306 domain-containing protein [Asticcacaulis sp.]
MSAITSFISAFSHPHLPHISLLYEVSPVIQIHLLAAVVAFVIGAVQIYGPKGTGMHRVLGWTWVIFMLVVAGSSFFIKVITHGSFSFIHILSGLTLITAPLIIYTARKKDIKAHKRHALRLYGGAMLVAGLFTFVPGRLMWRLFFS